MLLIIYAFISFLFFKIMPEFMFRESMTVLGALLAAVVSAFCMFAMTMAVNIEGMKWLAQRKPSDGTFPIATIFAFAAALIVAVGAGYLVAVGFAPRFVGRLYRDDIYWFLGILALPPLVHYVILTADIVRMAKQIERDRDNL